MGRLRPLAAALSALFWAAAGAASADDLAHRDFVDLLVRRSMAEGRVAPGVWLSVVDVEGDAGWVTRNSGRLLLDVPPRVASAYDLGITKDMVKLYEPASPRVRAIATAAVPFGGFFVSAGHDTGLHAAKIDVRESWFLGASKGFPVGDASWVVVHAGGWLGERIRERPCLDAYDRAYWCPKLIAWTDRPPLKLEPEVFLELKWLRAF